LRRDAVVAAIRSSTSVDLIIQGEGVAARSIGIDYTVHSKSLDVQITKALAQDPRTAKVVIDVAYLSGRATLLGKVGSLAIKAAVLEVVRAVPGVITIDDEIAVKAGAR
jgi:osmotically-inducible protein OsmY